MKQQVVVFAGEQPMDALAPILRQAHGMVFEHVIDVERAEKRLGGASPELLILVHPLPGHETVAFWKALRLRLGARTPPTVVVASPEDLFDLEPLQEAGVPLIDRSRSAAQMQSALLPYLRQAPRPYTRVMVKVAVELGAGKILRIAQTVNLSRSGLLIRTRETFPAGSTLDLRLELPDGEKAIEARAEVVRLADPEIEDVRGVGARFVWFREEDEERFDDFMRRAILDSASSNPA